MTRPATETARRLRDTETDPEHRLWELLRGRRLAAAKFRRQHPIGRFVVDFFCPSARLAIELDGSDHLQPDRIVHDDERTKVLGARAIRVLRFSNDEVLREPERVTDSILSALRAERP